ncbi:MAG: alpha/beta fold hydrolase, partial [Candidatus Binatia bacterium]
DPALVERALDAASKDRDVETVIAVARTAFAADLRATGAAVRAPALVVTGELDMTCPVAAGAEMANVLRTAHHVVPGKGHVITLEDPTTVAAMILAHAARNDE